MTSPDPTPSGTPDRPGHAASGDTPRDDLNGRDDLRDNLIAIASNYVWTWDQELRQVLDAVVGTDWGDRHPLALLRALNEDDLRAVVDAELARRIHDGAETVRSLEARSPGRDGTPVDTAYISAEFGVSETLPQYSGGLGILAGDHLKAASDQHLSLVGVGLFYANGYFVQSLTGHGQDVDYGHYDPAELGLTDTGQVITVETPRGTIAAWVWMARVGSIRLYLLDSRAPGNAPWAREVTDRLYGGDQQRRIDQEMLLGIGGLRALDAVGITPTMVHLNEGHAGFCLLELLAKELAAGRDWATAQAAVRSRTLFTTHTPVPAGIDRFPRRLLEPYLDDWCERTGVAIETIWAEGRLPADEAPDEFNMAAFCLGHAAITNGVSALHGEVSRDLFASRPEGAAITSVTNGVHARTWTDPATQALLDRHLPRLDRSLRPGGWENGDPARWAAAADIPDDEIRALRRSLRANLVAELKRRDLVPPGGRRGATAAADPARNFDPDALTIGFARRFATYKRAALLLRDPERLAALLGDDDRPVQFVFAGKAHPADIPGQALLAEIVAYSTSAEANGRFVFVPGYDMAIAATLYSGCDVWLNNPVRPQEACGTSGEKAALNGALNCSILDGWWAEWYDPANGWAIPTSEETDPEQRDQAEATALHDVLANEVVPTFYGRTGDPGSTHRPGEAWIERIRVGWQVLGPKITAGRMVAEYRDRLYRPIIDGAGPGTITHRADPGSVAR